MLAHGRPISSLPIVRGGADFQSRAIFGTLQMLTGMLGGINPWFFRENVFFKVHLCSFICRFSSVVKPFRTSGSEMLD